MITEALLDIIFTLIGSLFELIPALDFPWMQSIADAINTIAEYIIKADKFIPVVHVFIVLAAVVSIPAFKFMFFIINWIIRRIADVIP